MELKIKKLHKDAVIPQYAHSNDSGMDLYALEEITFFSSTIKVIKTGLAIQLPSHSEAQIRPKSGLSLNKFFSCVLGTIDEGYRGELGVIAHYLGNVPYTVKKGQKVAQMVICPILRPKIIVDDNLSTTERGNGGYGSTGV